MDHLVVEAIGEIGLNYYVMYGNDANNFIDNPQHSNNNTNTNDGTCIRLLKC